MSLTFEFPWVRKREIAKQNASEALRAQIADDVRLEISAEIETTMVRAAESAAQIARGEAITEMGEIARSLVTSPLPMIPDPNAKPPYGAYHFNRPITFSTPQDPNRRPGTLVSVDTLRVLADTYEVLRACINHLKREVYAVPIEVVPKDDVARKALKKGGSTLDPGMQARLAAARALFSENGAIGGVGTTRREFESRLIEDLCVVGAAAIFHQRSRGGKTISSVDIDAATIRPFVDAYGWAPGDTGPGSDMVYEQWIYGCQVGTFSRKDLTYRGLYSTTYSPFPKSPVEWIIDTIDTALRTKVWNKSWLTDGTTPDMMFSVPEGWTPEQLYMYAEYFNSMLAGNTAQRRLAKFLPAGSAKVGAAPRKDNDFAGMDLWLARITCAIMGVQMASIGFVGEQYKVSQDASMDATTIFGAGAILSWREERYNDLLDRHGFPEFEVVNVTERQKDAKVVADTNAVLIASGQRSINECRRADGEDPIPGDLGDTFLVSNTTQTLDSVLNPPSPVAPAVPPETTNPVVPPETQPPADIVPPAKSKTAKRSAPMLGARLLLRVSQVRAHFHASTSSSISKP